jgi:class 3 adenylate cyclase
MTLPSGTVTFLFTDIEGSTKLAQQYSKEMPNLLRRHREILQQSIQAQMSDADFARFSAEGKAMTVEEAVALALKE